VSVAVVGHVEWVEFAVVDHVPAPGTIVFTDAAPFADAGGGGAVAAVQLAKLAGSDASFLTSVGGDELGRRTVDALRGHGVTVHAAVHDVPQRRAFTHLDAAGERTITVLGPRHIPLGADDLPWDKLAAAEAVYFTGGDAAALRTARASRRLVATPRALDVLATAGVELDVLVLSADDPDEAVEPGVRANVVVLTEGASGGTWSAADGASGRWDAVAPPGRIVDAYGCGDSFAAGLTYGLGSGLRLPDALALAARCGAWSLAGRGPYGNQLSSARPS
jgi:ribokinase